MSDKITTFDLIEMWLDLQATIDELQEKGETSPETMERMRLCETEMRKQFSNKVDHIDSFVLELNQQIEALKAKKKVIDAESKRIYRKITARNRLRNRMNHVLIPSIIKTVGKDGVLETESVRYKLTTLWKELSYDPTKVDDQYIISSTPVIDKVALRKDAIAAAKRSQFINGIQMTQIESVRRS